MGLLISASEVLSVLDRVFGQERADEWRDGVDALKSRIRGLPELTAPALELSPGTWAGVLRVKDRTGRFLGEGHGLPLQAHTHPSIKFAVFTGPGSRAGRLYNLPAMKQVAKSFKIILKDIATLRRHMRLRNPEASGPLSWVELYVLARTCTSIPAFLLRRADSPIADGELDPDTASLFKVMAGVHASLEPFFEARSNDESTPCFDLSAPVDIDEFYEFIETNGLLVAASGHVCAGPKMLILNLLRGAVLGSDEPPALGRLRDRAVIERILDYGISTARMSLRGIRDSCALRLALEPWLEGPLPSNRRDARLASSLRAAVGPTRPDPTWSSSKGGYAPFLPP